MSVILIFVLVGLPILQNTRFLYSVSGFFQDNNVAYMKHAEACKCLHVKCCIVSYLMSVVVPSI